MKTYLSGQITEISTAEMELKFHKAQEELLKSGKDIEVINANENHVFSLETPFSQIVAARIEKLLECEAIFFMLNYGQCKIARMEYAIAREMGLLIIFQQKIQA